VAGRMTTTASTVGHQIYTTGDQFGRDVRLSSCQGPPEMTLDRSFANVGRPTLTTGVTITELTDSKHTPTKVLVRWTTPLACAAFLR